MIKDKVPKYSKPQFHFRKFLFHMQLLLHN